jgi:hypothetical protein
VQLPPPPKLPDESLEKPTVPVGVEAVPDAVSVTVAVHEVALPTATELGEQLTPVDVERPDPPEVTVISAELSGLEFAAWFTSPKYST